MKTYIILLLQVQEDILYFVMTKFYLRRRLINGIKQAVFCCHSNNFYYGIKNFKSPVSVHCIYDSNLRFVALITINDFVTKMPPLYPETSFSNKKI